MTHYASSHRGSEAEDGESIALAKQPSLTMHTHVRVATVAIEELTSTVITLFHSYNGSANGANFPPR